MVHYELKKYKEEYNFQRIIGDCQHGIYPSYLRGSYLAGHCMLPCRLPV